MLSPFVPSLFVRSAEAADAETPDILDRENLVAWCIVPFDAARRTPAERALMVRQLGIKRVAYDWREEHVASFEEEIRQYQTHGLEFFAFWSWHPSLEPLIERYGIRPQIWITSPSPSAETKEQRVSAAARELLPLVDIARRLELQLGLYNHGGWGGEPENLIAVCQYLRASHQAEHVGIVYNFHHGHDHVATFADVFPAMKPYLLCVNINGMADPKLVNGMENKILPVGQGVHEETMLRTIRQAQYRGPIGILDHLPEQDALTSLQNNLNGIEKLRR
ncbi:MAG: hypothetical protein KDA88_05185 [Planctomycetaceae bacterium]|nr:hypothetical protein [Planctomycetaceae bacterium]